MWQVRWEQEEEDFEGFIKRFRPDSTYCYEVAYDDGDEEWGWFSATHFHTDEVQRKFTWLQEQDEQVAKAASKAWAALEGSQNVSSSFEQKASTASVERECNATAPKAAATATASGAIGNLALRKDQLRAIQDVLSDSKPVLPSPASTSRHKNGLQQASGQSALLAKPSSLSTSQQQPASLSDLVPSAAELAVSTQRSAPDAKLAAASYVKPTVASDVTSANPVANKAAHDGQSIMVQEPSRASQLSTEGSLRPKVSPSAAAKLQLETGQQPSKQVTHTKKRKAPSLQEPNNSMPETEASMPTKSNAVNGHIDDGSMREAAGNQPSAASAQEQPAKQIAQPSPTSASLPETLVLQAEASENAQEQAQPQGCKSPNHDAGRQQHAGAPGHTKRPSPEKHNAKQKAAAERRVKRAHDPLSKPQPSPVKEGKRRRLRKASELNPPSEDAAISDAVAQPEPPATGPSEDLDADDIQVREQPSCQHFPCIVGISQI